MIPLCLCGKQHAFATHKDALDFINNTTLEGPLRPYECPEGKGYHVTSSTFRKPTLTYKLKSLEKELHEEMAKKTIRQRIVDYMLDSYNRNHTTKFSSQMVVFALQQETPKLNKQQIYQEISKLKNHEKRIVSLDEVVPDQRGATYFTLTEILDKETKPVKLSDKQITEIQNIPAPTAPVTNPFDKVHDKLDQLSTDQNSLSQIFQGGVLHIEDLLKGMEVDPDALAEILVKKLGTSNAPGHPDDWASLTEALVNRKDPDSFIYHMREEILSATDGAVSEIKNMLGDPDDKKNYRDGFKDGIKFAIEMGLRADG